MEEPPGSTTKTICFICFDDLRPVLEDLQAIPVRGHVFHSHCMQQWFEYSPETKKHSCPVCKQACAANEVCRLYFQSFGDGNDAFCAVPIACGHKEDDRTVLRKEVKRLEAKVGGLTSVVDQQGKDLKLLNGKLQFFREQVKKEASLKEDTFKQKMTIQQLLHMKSQELDKTALECLGLQERNMALAKELAALILVADLDLEEDEILNLSCLGNESNIKDTIDVLRKSLVIRNKWLSGGPGEGPKLEAAIEIKDNQALRALKDSKRLDLGIKAASFTYSTGKKNIPGDKQQRCSQPLSDFSLFGDAMKDANAALGKKNIHTVKNGFASNDKMRNGHVDLSLAQFFSADKGIADGPMQNQTVPNDGSVKANPPSTERFSSLSYEKIANSGPNVSALKESGDKKNARTENDASDDDLIILNDIMRENSILNIRKETLTTLPLCIPGDICISGGLLGLDGTPRYLGKWCKRGQDKTVIGTKSTSISNGNLIAIGSDGTGGRVKALRSSIQSSVDDKEKSVKRCKSLSKFAFSQSQGGLQIERFFGKISN